MTRRSWRRGALIATLASAGALVPASAMAAAPIAISPPNNAGAPQLAYDATTQTTYVAWSDPVQPGVDLCVLPVGANTCESGAPVLLTDTVYPGYTTTNHPGIGGLVVLPGGEIVVIGTPVSTGTIAWASAPGGAAFFTAGQGLENGGNFISPVSLFYTAGNAVALSSTDVALLDDYANKFSDSPFVGPESPAIPAPNSNPGGFYPRKALGTDGAEIAAMTAPAPAPAGTDIVVGVGDNFAQGPPQTIPGCLNSAGTGYGVSVGTVSGNSKAAGTLNAQGLPAYQSLTCSAQNPVLTSGGQGGIGVVETEGNGVSGAGSTFTVDFRPFVATATGGTFGAPVQLQDVTGVSLLGIDELDASDDSATGVYTSWVDHQGLVLDYSANAGASWGGPVVDPLPGNIGPGSPVIAGVGGGNAKIAFESNPGTGNQVFLQSVNYQALAVAPDTILTSQTAGTTTGSSISVPAGTVGENDRASVSGANGSFATGTMTYRLFSTSSCASSSQVFSSATTVSGGVAAASAGVSTALAQGKYYWQATYSGDAFNDPGVSACGSEILTVTPAASLGGGGSSNGVTITITVTCASTPCTVTITITITETTHGTRAVSASKKRTKTVTIAKGTFTIHKHGKRKLAVKLTKAGKKLLKKDHGHLKAKLLLSTKVDGHREKVSRTIHITTAKKHHKR